MGHKEVSHGIFVGVVVNGKGDPADHGVPPVVRARPQPPVMGVGAQDGVEETFVVRLVEELTVLRPNTRR